MTKIEKTLTDPTHPPNHQESLAAVGHRRTRADHASELAEDYVELIDDLILEHGEARLVDIADRLGVSHVTANKTVARLQRDGLAVKRPYRAIFLTDEGKKLAETSRRKHETVLQFLKSIGVPTQQAEIDAEGIEHHISDVTLNIMSKLIKSNVR